MKFATDERSLIQECFRQNKNIFLLHIDIGPMLVLNARYADAIKSDGRLSPRRFNATVWILQLDSDMIEGYVLIPPSQTFQSHTPGFQPFKFFISEHHIAQDIVRMKLNKNLGPNAFILSVSPSDFTNRHAPSKAREEAADIIRKQWMDSTGKNFYFTHTPVMLIELPTEWHEFLAYPTALYVVAQTSGRAMDGPDPCRNVEWLALATGCTTQVFQSLGDFKQWPGLLRPVVHRFLLGQRPRKGEAYDPAVAQLTIAVASLHSTVDLLVQLLVDLTHNPELIQHLREEVSEIKREKGGLSTSALYNLELMDSVLKESQRLKPVSQNIKMRDGTIIPKGLSVCVPAEEMWSASHVPDPLRFDGYRHFERDHFVAMTTYASLVALPSSENVASSWTRIRDAF
ncbi:cytochrome P450 [Macrophomina phaseolina]|uniref:Cytochrome P450 n=1 Tax=Macrophomina phaseolina TaxID=35725 RepID=A0ABQ8FQU2_9PEZI|nr:cytochrome P450 [Macrophomina phaseolina]